MTSLRSFIVHPGVFNCFSSFPFFFFYNRSLASPHFPLQTRTLSIVWNPCFILDPPSPCSICHWLPLGFAAQLLNLDFSSLPFGFGYNFLNMQAFFLFFSLVLLEYIFTLLEGRKNKYKCMLQHISVFKIK